MPLLRHATDVDGLPIPPPRLMYDVAGTDDVEWFLRFGRATARTLHEVVAQAHRPLETFERMLDFGCGCGRVLRHFAELDHVELHGTDVRRGAVAWCRRNLQFAKFDRNKLTPPTVYDDGTFDFVYAISVFTHLPEALQVLWLDELRRILRPHGLLAITTHGDQYLDQLSADEARDFTAGRLVVRRADAAGLNACAAFHPRSWVERTVKGRLEVIDFAASGTFTDLAQDLYLLRATGR